eukprot:2439028-Rhodomonas_salina.1
MAIVECNPEICATVWRSSRDGRDGRAGVSSGQRDEVVVETRLINLDLLGLNSKRVDLSLPC